MQLRTDCKADLLTTTIEEPGLTPHSSQQLFSASDNSFFFFFFSVHTLILIHAHLAVGNHPEIENEKKDVCNRTRRGSNWQYFDWKSTAQITEHNHARSLVHTLHTHTYRHIHTHTHIYTHCSGLLTMVTAHSLCHLPVSTPLANQSSSVPCVLPTRTRTGLIISTIPYLPE